MRGTLPEYSCTSFLAYVLNLYSYLCCPVPLLAQHPREPALPPAAARERVRLHCPLLGAGAREPERTRPAEQKAARWAGCSWCFSARDLSEAFHRGCATCRDTNAEPWWVPDPRPGQQGCLMAAIPQAVMTPISAEH